MSNPFLRTPWTARMWLGPIQIQVWRDGFWLVSWQGRTNYAVVSWGRRGLDWALKISRSYT